MKEELGKSPWMRAPSEIAEAGVMIAGRRHSLAGAIWRASMGFPSFDSKSALDRVTDLSKNEK